MYRALKHWSKYKLSNRFIYRFAMLSFLYAVANGMVGFLLPVYLEEKLKSLTIVGLILAFSSIWNIITDLVIGFLKKPPTYRLFMQLVGLSLVVFFGGVWLFDSVWMLILAALIWGIFTELHSFATFDFVINACEEESRGLNFGLMSNFRSLGYTVAPIIAGAVILNGRDLTMTTGLFFSVMILLLFNLQLRLRKMPNSQCIVKRRLKLKTQIKLWLRIGRRVLPFLSVTLVEGMSDGVLTSFLPIFVVSTPQLKTYGGLILALSCVPIMLLAGYFGHLADKHGHKQYILMGLLVSAISLSFLGFSQSAIVAAVLSLLTGVGYSLYSPALNAQQSEYVDKHHNQESEVVGETGMSYNFGFIIGAGLVGFLITILHGYGWAFAVFGLMHLLVMVLYWAFENKKFSFLDGEVA